VRIARRWSAGRRCGFGFGLGCPSWFGPGLGFWDWICSGGFERALLGMFFLEKLTLVLATIFSLIFHLSFHFFVGEGEAGIGSVEAYSFAPELDWTGLEGSLFLDIACGFMLCFCRI
jgi:hypothetical protein